MSAVMDQRCTVCGHGGADHQSLAPQCSHARCTCLRYRPLGAVTPSAPAPPPTPRPEVGPRSPTVEELVRACGRSKRKRTQSLAMQLTTLQAKITDALRDERAATAAKSKQSEEFKAKKATVDALAAQLAAAKAELRGLKPAGTAPTGEHACGECGDLFGTSQGRSLHARRKHGVGA